MQLNSAGVEQDIPEKFPGLQKDNVRRQQSLRKTGDLTLSFYFLVVFKCRAVQIILSDSSDLATCVGLSVIVTLDINFN